MSDNRIIDLRTTAEDFAEDDYAVIDSQTEGTRKMPQGTLKEKLRDSTLGGIHGLPNEAESLDGSEVVAVDGLAGALKTKLSTLASYIHGKWAAFVDGLENITAFADNDYISVSNPVDGTRKMRWDALNYETSKNVCTNFASEYDPTDIYVQNQVVIYGNLLYKSKYDILSPEPWTASHWENTTVDDVIQERISITNNVIYSQTTNTHIIGINGERVYGYVTLNNKAYLKNLHLQQGPMTTEAWVFIRKPKGITLTSFIIDDVDYMNRVLNRDGGDTSLDWNSSASIVIAVHYIGRFVMYSVYNGTTFNWPT